MLVLVMWWNFVSRTHEEIVQAREDWMAGRRFGQVSSCIADPLPAPALPTVRLKARDRNGGTSGSDLAEIPDGRADDLRPVPEDGALPDPHGVLTGADDDAVLRDC